MPATFAAPPTAAMPLHLHLRLQPLLLVAVVALATQIPPTVAAATSQSKYMQMNELLQDLQIYQGLTYITLGIQFWEHVLTLRFEWQIYRGRLPWRHGMIAYVIIRYSTWASLIPTLINICARKPIDCQASLDALLVTLSTAVIMTSLIFIIRCIAVWNKNVWVTVLLGSLWLAEAIMQLTSPFRMRSRWIQGACQTWFTTSAWKFNFAYLLAECTDLVTFALAAWKLRDMRAMGLGKVLFQQSVIYIGISTALNTLCLVLIYLELSPVLSYLCSPFAMTISGILACRAFRDLQLAGHSGHPDLCFVKSSGILWATRDIQARSGPGQPPGDVATRRSDNAIASVAGECFDARQIVDGAFASPTTSGVAAPRMPLCEMPMPKQDWITRSGFAEPTLLQRRQACPQTSYIDAAAGRECFSLPPNAGAELPRPATSPEANDRQQCYTYSGAMPAGAGPALATKTTTFLGFLLDEEQAQFDAEARQRREGQHLKAGAAAREAPTAAAQHHLDVTTLDKFASSTPQSSADGKSDTAAAAAAESPKAYYDEGNGGDAPQPNPSTSCLFSRLRKKGLPGLDGIKMHDVSHASRRSNEHGSKGSAGTRPATPRPDTAKRPLLESISSPAAPSPAMRPRPQTAPSPSTPSSPRPLSERQRQRERREQRQQQPGGRPSQQAEHLDATTALHDIDVDLGNATAVTHAAAPSFLCMPDDDEDDDDDSVVDALGASRASTPHALVHGAAKSAQSSRGGAFQSAGGGSSASNSPRLRASPVVMSATASASAPATATAAAASFASSSPSSSAAYHTAGDPLLGLSHADVGGGQQRAFPSLPPPPRSASGSGSARNAGNKGPAVKDRERERRLGGSGSGSGRPVRASTSDGTSDLVVRGGREGE